MICFRKIQLWAVSKRMGKREAGRPVGRLPYWKEILTPGLVGDNNDGWTRKKEGK